MASSLPPDDQTPNPAYVFDTLNAFQRSAALVGAIELGVFTAISTGVTTAQDLATHCQADARGMRILCDFLVVHHFLTKSDETYGLTATAALCLVRTSPMYMGTAAKFLRSPDLVRAFDDVAGLVRNGGTLLQQGGTTDTDYAGWVEFARSMVPLMRQPAEFLGQVAAQELTGPIRVLDIAAGHGLFGISVAHHNLAARITALDWPAVLAVATENAAAAGIADRHAVLQGDAFEIDYGTGYDLVLLTNILHHFDLATCGKLMSKVHHALRPGGLVLTLEFVPNADRVSPPMPATFSMTMLGTTPRGDAFTFAEYDQLFQQHGFLPSRMLDALPSPQRLLVTRRD